MVSREIIFGLILLSLILPASATTWNNSYDFAYNSPTQNGSRPLWMLVNISNNTVAFGNTTHLNVTCYQNNCTELTFTLENSTVLPSIRMVNTSGSDYGLWLVKITGNGSVQVQSGATGITDTSDWNNTAPISDKFSGTVLDANKWDSLTGGSGTVTVAGNAVTINAPSGTVLGGLIRSKTTIPFPYVMIVEYNMTGGDTGYKVPFLGVGDNGDSFNAGLGGNDSSGNSGVFIFRGGTNDWRIGTKSSGTATVNISVWGDSNDKILAKIESSATHAYFYMNGTLMRDHVTNIPSTRTDPFVAKISSHDSQPGSQYILNIFKVLLYPKNASGAWGIWNATQQVSSNIISWGNNRTNNQNLILSVPQNTVINFNITTNVVPTYYNATLNGIDQNNNFNNFTLTASSLAGYTVMLSAYSSTTATTASKTWIVSVTALSYTGGEGRITSNTVFMLGNGANITVLALQNFTQIDLFNASESLPYTLQFLINGSRARFNSSSDKTISNISYYPQQINGSRGWNFTLNNGVGNMSTGMNVAYPLMNYSLYKDGALIERVLSNATGWLFYNVSGAGNYSIQRNLSKPYLISPANNSGLTTTVLSFAWSNESSAQYNIQVARDSAFSIIDADNNVATNSTVIEVLYLTNYYWRVRTYDGISTYGEWSEPFTFNALQYTMPISDGSTGIQGYVFEIKSIGSVRLLNAIVSISNLTWTSSTTTDINGYYRFTGLANNSIYSLKATAKNYNDGNVELVTTTNGTWVIKNLYLTACVSSFTCNVNQQFITFIVQNLWWTKYTNVLSTVYKGTDLTQPFIYQSSTGKDGSANFWLVKDQQYTITFINASQGISITWTGYPPLSGYQYIITSATSSGSFTNNTDQLTAIAVVVSSNTTNSTSANIYVNYSDSLAQTSSLLFTLNTSIPGDPNNQTQLQTKNGGSNSVYNATFTVNNYQGQGYLIKVTANHQTFGAISYSYIIQFPVSTPLSSFNPISVLMMLVGIILFVAGFFGQTSTEQGSGVIVGLVWLFSGVGLFSNVNLGLSFYLGATLATVIVVIMNLNARARREGIS